MNKCVLKLGVVLVAVMDGLGAVGIRVKFCIGLRGSKKRFVRATQSIISNEEDTLGTVCRGALERKEVKI
jgi:hypothetical protein